MLQARVHTGPAGSLCSMDTVRKIDRSLLESELSSGHTRYIEKVADQARHVRHLALDHDLYSRQ